MKNVTSNHHFYSSKPESHFRMKQRNFRDVEYLKKSQKDISDKINGALDEVLAKQKSSTRPISAPSKGSFIMKAAAQARFSI